VTVDLVCVGDVMLDVHVASGALARGGDVHGRVALRPGGTSANAAVWAAWSGATSGVVAAIGDDLAGRLCREAVSERGVDVGGIATRPIPTGVMVVMTEEGERSMVADRGANATLEPDDVRGLEGSAVLVSGYLLLQDPGHDVALAAIDGARDALVAIEAASWPLIDAFGAERFFEETAPCDVVCANDREAEALVGRTGEAAARVLGERYRFAAVKRGAAGAVLVADGHVLIADAEPIDERESTGAGDAFDGVLLAELARGRAPVEALTRATHAGALVAASWQTWPAEGAA
jgi:sugar/nucleoside kinase (ribokinase family)